MSNVDYQWPSNILPVPARASGTRKAARLKEELEDRFTRMLGADSLVLPSGRAALSLALKLSNTERRHVVFAPRFSSHCVWNVVGRYGNPVINFADPPDVTIAVHKFGIPHCFDTRRDTLVIEDSCDSIVLGREACFPNTGEVEIFSLPKIMGAYGGGVLACRTAEIAASARRLIAMATPLIGDSQGLLRWKMATGDRSAYNLWDANEYDNFHPDETLLTQLLDHFDKIEVNRRTIESRLRAIEQLAGQLVFSRAASAASTRLPPVLSSARLAESTTLMMRHINEAGLLDQPRFVKHGLVPLHFGVSDEFFQRCVAEAIVSANQVMDSADVKHQSAV
jgi:putative PLP-dependent aminotransferase (TIGR04422 family)